VLAALAELDDTAVAAAAMRRRVLLTHGEPHRGNLIWTPNGLRLLDWDTVAVGFPERDLWMVNPTRRPPPATRR